VDDPRGSDQANPRLHLTGSWSRNFLRPRGARGVRPERFPLPPHVRMGSRSLKKAGSPKTEATPMGRSTVL
jgi:hypothetical protein